MQEAPYQSLVSVALPLLIVLGVGIAFAWWLLVGRRVQIARRLVEEQHHVLDDGAVDRYALQLPLQQRPKWFELMSAVKETTGGTVRTGHLVWAMGVLEGAQEPGPPPTFAPPSGDGYELERDIGLPSFHRYMKAKAAGDLITAYAELAAGSDRGSPLCMSAFGAALATGEVPGRPADSAEGLRLMNRAAEAGGNSTTLAEFLVEGKAVPRDLDRGLPMWRRAAQRDRGLTAIELAAVYNEGLHGVVADRAEALRVGLLAAPAWRRLAARCGMGQGRWLDRQLVVVRDAKQRLAAMKGWDLQRARRQFFDELK